MRLVERRRLIKKARAAAEEKSAAAVLSQLQSRYRSLKRELRKGNLHKRMAKFEKAKALPPGPEAQAIQPGADGWQEWIDAFTTALTEALMEGADKIGSIEGAVWESRGMPRFVFDPAKVVAAYQSRTGKQIKKIGEDTRDHVLQDVTDWYNTDAGLPSLLEDLGEYFGEARAALIAATETAYITSELADEQMGQYGINKWIWSSFNDWIRCPKCEDLDGQVFNRGDPMPPDASHPGCRCDVIFADDSGEEM